MELSRLLKVASFAPEIMSLVKEILQKTTVLVPELCLAVVKILYNHGRSSDALALLEKQFANDTSQNGVGPWLSLEKGRILQGSKTCEAAQAFELAISQFTKQLGPLHNTTLCSRREYAHLRLKIGDYNIATNMLKDVLATLFSLKVYTRKQTRLIDTCSEDIKRWEGFPSSDSSILTKDYQSLTLSTKRKFSASDIDSGLQAPEQLHCDEGK